MSQYQNKTASTGKTDQSRQIVNFTSESFKRYDNVKIINLIQTLQAHGLEPDVFAKEISSYFKYHSERKQNVIDVLKDSILAQKQLQHKLMEDHERNNSWMLKEFKSSRNNKGLPPMHSMRAKPSATKPLLALFIEHIDAMKKEMR